MLKIKYSLIIMYLSALALCGCKQYPQDIPKLSLQARDQYLSQMQAWQAEGKVGISDGHQGHNVSMAWQQEYKNYNIHFSGPFASGDAKIISKPGNVILTISDGQKYSGDDAEALLFEHLGWELPFNDLTFWIKGLAAPHSAPTIKKFDQYNQLQILQQDGWLINYQSYLVYGAITLPEKITLTNGNFKIKLIINNWRVAGR